MAYRLAANLVLLIHLAFVFFVLFGGFLVLRWRCVAWIHIPAVVWGALVEYLGWFCPLTPLENYLRQTAGQAGYEGGFVEHYLILLLYPAQLNRELQIFLVAAVVLINLAIYGWLLFRIGSLGIRH